MAANNGGGSFRELGMSENLVLAVRDRGFEEPSPIQEAALKKIIEGSSIIATAGSGTGKTSMIAIAVCEIVDTSIPLPQILIVSSRISLALELQNTISSFGYPLGIRVNAISSNAPYIDNTHVLLGAPGYLCDQLARRRFNLSELKIIFVDDTEEMEDAKLLQNINSILRTTHRNINQLCLIGSSTPHLLLQTVTAYDLEFQNIDSIHSGFITEHYIINVHNEDAKLESLHRFLDFVYPMNAIILCKSKIKVDQISSSLREKNGITVALMHGDVLPRKRDLVIDQFRSGEVNFVVTTDLKLSLKLQAAIVVVYDFPEHSDVYMRWANKACRGFAISFAKPSDLPRMKGLEVSFISFNGMDL